MEYHENRKTLKVKVDTNSFLGTKYTTPSTIVLVTTNVQNDLLMACIPAVPFIHSSSNSFEESYVVKNIVGMQNMTVSRQKLPKQRSINLSCTS